MSVCQISHLKFFLEPAEVVQHRSRSRSGATPISGSLKTFPFSFPFHHVRRRMADVDVDLNGRWVMGRQLCRLT